MKKPILNVLKTSCIVGLFLVASCAKTNLGPDDPDNPDAPGGSGGNAIPNSLHLAFETPDWKRQIDCTHLDLSPGDAADPEVVYVRASSASAFTTFTLSYPKYASELEKAENIGIYPVGRFNSIPGSFQYTMKLPLDDDKLDVSFGRLESKAGQSDTEFTEITEIKRIGTDGDYGVFQIKGRYGFNSTFVNSGSVSESGKYVKGSFHLKIRALLH
ncbi:hypothetical protein [Parapedobacter sp. DT-150]|uniref:hypothetical protein n=1 Tax=Parapedobacter sp. DT-150 TaxID=3396162 RepID=UPI003F1C0683